VDLEMVMDFTSVFFRSMAILDALLLDHEPFRGYWRDEMPLHL
jgi:hypothetical protein